MRKAAPRNRVIDIVLICLRSTPIDHVISSPGELLCNRKIISNLPVKCTNNNVRKDIKPFLSEAIILGTFHFSVQDNSSRCKTKTQENGSRSHSLIRQWTSFIHNTNSHRIGTSPQPVTPKRRPFQYWNAAVENQPQIVHRSPRKGASREETSTSHINWLSHPNNKFTPNAPTPKITTINYNYEQWTFHK